MTTKKIVKKAKAQKGPKNHDHPHQENQPTQPQPQYQPFNVYQYRKLYRSTRDKWIAGVCGGIAEHFNKDPTMIRLLWIALTIVSVGVGVLAYVAFWFFVDKYPSYYVLPSYSAPLGEQRKVHYHYYYGASH